MTSSGPRVAVLGATGATGRAASCALSDAGVGHLLAAREPDRIPDSLDGERVRIDVRHLGDLRRLCDRVDVVVNCVGPYTTLGEPVVEAALAARTHLVDLSGEQPWLRRVHDGFDARARRAGVRIVPGVGVEVGVADIAAAELRLEADRRPWRVRSTMAVEGLRPTRGSRQSVLAVASATTWALRGGRLVEAPAARRWRRCHLPERPGERWVVSMPGGEIVTGSWHLEAESIEAWIAGPIVAAPLVGALATLVPRLAGGPVHQVLRRVADLGGAGASSTSRFDLFVEVDTAALSIRGEDVYALSGRLAALAASDLVDAEGAGVLAPGQVLDLAAVRRYLPTLTVERVR